MKRRDFLCAGAALAASSVAHADMPFRLPFMNEESSSRVNLTFSYVTAVGSVKDQTVRYLADRVQQLSDGKVTITAYPSSRLYPDGEEFDALIKGEVDLIAPSLAKLGSVGVPEALVFDVPYVVTSFDQASKALQGTLGARIRSGLGDKAHYLGAWHNGPKMFTSSRPIQSPEDFRGQRIRVLPNEVIEMYLKAFEAKPLRMGFSKVKAAVRAGQIDALENTPSNLAEVQAGWAQPYLIDTRHGFMSYGVLLSAVTAKRFSPQTMAVLQAAMQETQAFADRLAIESNEKALDQLRTIGMKTSRPGPEFSEAIKRALEPYMGVMTGMVGGKPFVDTVQREVA